MSFRVACQLTTSDILVERAAFYDETHTWSTNSWSNAQQGSPHKINQNNYHITEHTHVPRRPCLTYALVKTKLDQPQSNLHKQAVLQYLEPL